MKNEDDERPQSRAGLWVGIGLLLHLLALLLSTIAFFSPFWMVEVNSLYHTGLWGRCDDSELNCIWFHERNYAWERSLPSWHVASQVLYAIGYGLLILAFLLTIGHWIFRCCKLAFSIPVYIGITICVATLFELLSIIVFGSEAYVVYEVSVNSWLGHFEWAFFIGIAALFNCTFAAFFYIYGGRQVVKDMEGYEASYA
jgi:hypothetical protein